MRRRFYIVLNPTAGVPRRGFLTAVVDGLAARGATATVVEHADATLVGGAVRSAIGHYDAIVAAGGDGTIRQVAAALGNADVPLGIVPLGTGNVFAREIGLARNPAAVVQTLLDGAEVDIRGARANGAPFYLMAGVGFDARTVAALDQGWKRRIGRAAYGQAVLRAWQAPADELVVEIDDTTFAANWLIVTNARHYGGSFVLSPRRSIFTSGLEAVLIRAADRQRLFEQLVRLALGRLTTDDNSHVTTVPAKRLRIRSSSAVPVQIDGDKYATTPLTIDADGPQLRLIVPG